MALNFLDKIALLCFFTFSNLIASDDDLYDFYYKADLVMSAEQNFLGKISDLLTGSEIKTDILSLRTFSKQNKRICNMRALSDRLNSDIAEIHRKAHELGFYNSSVKYETHFLKNNKLRVIVFVDLGKAFKLKVNVNYVGKDSAFRRKYSERLKKASVNLTSSIENMKQLISEAARDLQRNGYYNPDVVKKRVWLDYASQEAVLNLTIDPGKKVAFSNTTIKAFPDIDATFIENRINWQVGEVFNIDKLERTSNDLRATQIFSKVKVKPEKDKVTNSEIPILISVNEDKKRTINVSLLYSGMRGMNFEKKSATNKRLKSVIGRFSWENCNAFGGGEKLKFAIEGAPIRIRERRTDHAFEVMLSRPDVFMRNCTAEYVVSRRQELTNVFFKKNDKISATLSYPMSFSSTVRVGMSLEKTYVDSCEIEGMGDEQTQYESFVAPIEFALNKTDNTLNPTEGYSFFSSYSFIKLVRAKANCLHTANGRFSYNLPLDELKKIVVAFSVAGKAIFGKSIDDIPLDKRIYAGGVSSVRGYANQMATEAIIGRDTVMGGKSTIEFSSEIRKKFSKNFGGALFWDGAKVFQNQTKRENTRIEKKRWFNSFGFGARYFTDSGLVIRADFAFPIKRRKDIDSKMQFILTLGQAL